MLLGLSRNEIIPFLQDLQSHMILALFRYVGLVTDRSKMFHALVSTGPAEKCQVHTILNTFYANPISLGLK
jgi:hypothetical protein